MSDLAIKVENVSKAYTIWRDPAARLKHPFLDLAGELFPALRPRIDQKMQGLCSEFYALKDVSFEVKKGESVGIIGRNGSGKSTLLQIIAGTLQPSEGSVSVNGRVAALLELGSGFNPEFTGRENVYLNGVILGLNHEEISERYEEIMQFSGIGKFIDQPVKTYSSGMVLRLAFAVSVCVDPDILIVDEALSVGDAAFQFKCLNRLRQLTSRGTTLLFVSHDMAMVKNFCDHALYLSYGVFKAVGAPDEISELYFLDLQDEQRSGAQVTGGVVKKPFLGEGKGIAYGTGEGQIQSATFTKNEGFFSSYLQGEEIGIQVVVKVRESILHPSICLIIQDRRMLCIGGAFFALKCSEPVNGWKSARITLRWPAGLSGGQYNITIRLENRIGARIIEPIDKQVGLLTFEIIEQKQTFVGPVDLCISAANDIRIVALLAVRNEALYLARCLEHLHQQGIESCIIDNESTDETLEIAKSFIGRGVFRIESQPFQGFFDLTAQLKLKEKLAREIDADWFMHQDADEIREAPTPYRTLKEGIEAADRDGYNAINFDEFVFLPTSECGSYEGMNYFEAMKYYYFYEPSPLRQIKAWKKPEQSERIAESGGHSIDFEGRRIYPTNFIMRHYIALSAKHAIRKYTSERLYSKKEVEENGWHGARAAFSSEKLNLPERGLLKNIEVGRWNKEAPREAHEFLG